MIQTTLLLRILPIVLVCVLPAVANSESQPEQRNKSTTTTTSIMRIRITINNTVLTGELHPNAAAKDFIALLPLALELTDYNQTEKIAQLPKKLSTANSPEGFTPVAGDLAFYAPWGNIALFYKGFSYSKGLIKLGTLSGDLGVLKQAAPQKALIELD